MLPWELNNELNYIYGDATEGYTYNREPKLLPKDRSPLIM